MCQIHRAHKTFMGVHAQCLPSKEKYSLWYWLLTGLCCKSTFYLIPKFLKPKHTKCMSFSWIKTQSHKKMLPINESGGNKWRKRQFLHLMLFWCCCCFVLDIKQHIYVLLFHERVLLFSPNSLPSVKLQDRLRFLQSCPQFKEITHRLI